jgi:LysR family glycine cleavage system transcriptional activator
VTQSDLPPLNWLRAFDAASRHLSFTDAAREMGLTQSAVSQQIKNLEGYLGTPLFYRRTRVLEITEAGHSYLPAVQDAFARLTAATQVLRGPNREAVLQVQSNLSFSVFWLAPRLPRLFKLHPWLRVLVSTALWDPERTASAADVEIRYSVGKPDGQAELLARDTYYPVCAPSLDVTGDNLFDFHFFDCNGLTANWAKWCDENNLVMPRDKAVTYASTLAVSLQAAQTGAGMALGHHLLAGDLVAEGRLKRPFPGQVDMQEAYYLIVQGQKKTPAQRAFSDWIVSEITA